MWGGGESRRRGQSRGDSGRFGRASLHFRALIQTPMWDRRRIVPDSPALW